jgi:hypothetical protein
MPSSLPPTGPCTVSPRAFRIQPDEAKRREAWEEDWPKVRQRAQRNGPSGQEDTRDAVSALFDAMPAERKDLSPKLELRMRINALLVIGVYQALVLVPVAIGALMLFWLVGRLTVSPRARRSRDSSRLSSRHT